MSLGEGAELLADKYSISRGEQDEFASGSHERATPHGRPDLDPAIVNRLDGAIAIGHPLGASGARILTTLVHHLCSAGGRFGLAAMCIGVGQGIAVVIENLTG